MKQPNLLRVTPALILMTVTIGAGAAPVASQSTFVSIKGEDNASCSAQAPCRHLQQAVASTAAGGEVRVINSGEFGAVHITRSVRILASPDVNAAIDVDKSTDEGGSRGVLIDAPGADVYLQGLTIRSNNGAAIGVQVRNAASVSIEDCDVSGFRHKGIIVTADTKARIRHTTFRDNFTALDSSARSLDIDGSVFFSNQTAVYTEHSTRISDTSITGDVNSEFGIVGHAPDGRSVRIGVERSTLIGTTVALYSHTEGTTGSVLLDVNHSALLGNASAFYAEGPSGSGVAKIDGHSVTSIGAATLAGARRFVQSEAPDWKSSTAEKNR